MVRLSRPPPGRFTLKRAQVPDNYLARKNVLEDVIAAHSQGGRVMVFTQVCIPTYLPTYQTIPLCAMCACLCLCEGASVSLWGGVGCKVVSLPRGPHDGVRLSFFLSLCGCVSLSMCASHMYKCVRVYTPCPFLTFQPVPFTPLTPENTQRKTKSEADELSTSSPYAAENTRVLHGDITQRQRELTLKQFR